jgi:hypothetical protein
MEAGGMSPGLFQSPHSRRASTRAVGELSPAASLDNSLYVTRTPLHGKVFLQDTIHDFVRASYSHQDVAQPPLHGGIDGVQHAFATPPPRMIENGENCPQSEGDVSNQMDVALLETRIVDLQQDLSEVEDVPFQELQLMVPPIGIIIRFLSLCGSFDTRM